MTKFVCTKLFHSIYCIYAVMLCILSSCDNSSDGIVHEVYTGNSEYTVRETSRSTNTRHEISTFVSNNSGMGIIIDGEFIYFDDYAIRYRPVISNNGKYAWAQQMKGKGYDIMWQDHSVFHSGACLDFVTSGSTKAIFSESDMGQFLTRLFLLDMNTGEYKCLTSLKNEYIEDINNYSIDSFGVITSFFDNEGNKLYCLYDINGESLAVSKVVDNHSGLLEFPKQEDHSNELLLDFVSISDNDKYLYNSLKLLNWGGHNNDAFAFGNDFRGRITWDVSQRLRGLCELYKKTNDKGVEGLIDATVKGILNARNQYTGVVLDEWNPEYLWSSKCYTINDIAACLLIESSEILSALLLACNEGIIRNNEIVSIAEKAFDYYDQWYKKGHYYQPYGFPASFDGIVVPWNYQNSFAEVCLGLYLETKDKKYLERCNELLSTFMQEWIEESDRIYWHYWPKAYYEGWTDDGRSINTPSSNPMTDNLFEDCSHAGISIRLMNRYVELIPNGIITNAQLNKMETNMKYFCFSDGFSRFISGDTGYNPKAWHYWISPYFAYFHNKEFEKYVRQGYLKCFPQWDSQESLFANAKLYESQHPYGIIAIDRNKLNGNGELELKESIQLSMNDVFKNIGILYY